MTVRNLKSLFEPQSVAIIGASQRPHSVGAITLSNMITGGFTGPILPVNPKYTTLGGLDVFASVAALPLAPDLAVICTPPATVPQLIRELGERGTRAVIVLSAGLDVVDEASGQTLKQLMLNAAKPYLLRILGPNCIGLLVPALGLNASFAHTGALPGNIAFVSQSGALVTGVLDWAKSRGIGFSRFVSLGESTDIDFGDLLDYLASDFRTHAILLYIEDIRFARKFMSAARAAARSKPVIVLKAGRVPEGAKAAASHTGALAGADDVYDAAIRRAGMLRVYSTDDLFNAVETLAHARSMSGDRLAIMTNGGGPGVMATDALIEAGGKLAALSAQTIAQLNQKLHCFQHRNCSRISASRYSHHSYRNVMLAGWRYSRTSTSFVFRSGRAELSYPRRCGARLYADCSVSSQPSVADGSATGTDHRIHARSRHRDRVGAQCAGVWQKFIVGGGIESGVGSVWDSDR